MSSDSESKVVVAGSSAEDIVQREALFWNIFKKKMIQRHCHHEFKTRYANTTGLLRHLEAYASKH